MQAQLSRSTSPVRTDIPDSLLEPHSTSTNAPLQESGIYTLPAKELNADAVEISSIELASKTAQELFKEIDQCVPETKYFNSVRQRAQEFSAAADIEAPELKYFPLKSQRTTHDENIIKQHGNCKYLASVLKEYKQLVLDFFANQKIPGESGFNEVKTSVNKSNSSQISVIEWINVEIPRLRNQVKKGAGTPLTPDQKAFNDYQLRSILPAGVIEAIRQQSDLKYKNRLERLAQLEREWNALTLVQLRNSEDVEIISTFLPILPKLNKLTNDAKTLAEAATKLRTDSETCDYAQKPEAKRLSASIEIPAAPDNLESSIAKQAEPKPQPILLEEVIRAKKELLKRLEALNSEKLQLQKEIDKILETNKKFNLDNCSDKSPILGYFIHSEADPKEKIDACTKEIFAASCKEMDVLCIALINQWNALCVDHFLIQQELLLAERIQDVKPQLAEIAEIAGGLCTKARDIRKSETQFKEASTKFAEIITTFKELSATLNAHNSYVCSRTPENYQPKGFKELYHLVIKEVNDSIAALKTAVTDSSLNAAGVILYNEETNKLAKSALSTAFAQMAEVQTRIGTSIEAKYNHLKNDTFSKLELEMYRINDVHEYISTNYENGYTGNPTTLYTTETKASYKLSAAKATGYPPKYPSPLG